MVLIQSPSEGGIEPLRDRLAFSIPVPCSSEADPGLRTELVSDTCGIRQPVEANSRIFADTGAPMVLLESPADGGHRTAKRAASFLDSSSALRRDRSAPSCRLSAVRAVRRSAVLRCSGRNHGRSGCSCTSGRPRLSYIGSTRSEAFVQLTGVASDEVLSRGGSRPQARGLNTRQANADVHERRDRVKS